MRPNNLCYPHIMPRAMPYMSLSHSFTSLVLFCLLAGCAIKEGPDSVQTTDSLFDPEPSAPYIEPSAGHKEPSAAADKEPSASHIDPSAAADKVSRGKANAVISHEEEIRIAGQYGMKIVDGQQIPNPPPNDREETRKPQQIKSLLALAPRRPRPPNTPPRVLQDKIQEFSENMVELFSPGGKLGKKIGKARDMLSPFSNKKKKKKNKKVNFNDTLSMTHNFDAANPPHQSTPVKLFR